MTDIKTTEAAQQVIVSDVDKRLAWELLNAGRAISASLHDLSMPPWEQLLSFQQATAMNVLAKARALLAVEVVPLTEADVGDVVGAYIKRAGSERDNWSLYEVARLAAEAQRLKSRPAPKDDPAPAKAATATVVQQVNRERELGLLIARSQPGMERSGEVVGVLRFDLDTGKLTFEDRVAKPTAPAKAPTVDRLLFGCDWGSENGDDVAALEIEQHSDGTLFVRQEWHGDEARAEIARREADRPEPPDTATETATPALEAWQREEGQGPWDDLREAFLSDLSRAMAAKNRECEALRERAEKAEQELGETQLHADLVEESRGKWQRAANAMAGQRDSATTLADLAERERDEARAKLAEAERVRDHAKEQWHIAEDQERGAKAQMEALREGGFELQNEIFAASEALQGELVREDCDGSPIVEACKAFTATVRMLPGWAIDAEQTTLPEAVEKVLMRAEDCSKLSAELDETRQSLRLLQDRVADRDAELAALQATYEAREELRINLQAENARLRAEVAGKTRLPGVDRDRSLPEIGDPIETRKMPDSLWERDEVKAYCERGCCLVDSHGRFYSKEGEGRYWRRVPREG